VHLCVFLCVCQSLAACPHYCMDPDVSWGVGVSPSCALLGRFAIGAWASLLWQHSAIGHGFRCYDIIAANAKCQRVLVLALCLVLDLRWWCHQNDTWKGFLLIEPEPDGHYWPGSSYNQSDLWDFWATICKMVQPMLSDRCLSCLWHWCIVAKRLVGSRRNLACR